MDVALLNVRIDIQQSKAEVDDVGNHTNAWTDYYSCAATVSGETPSESAEAGTIVDSSKIDFTIRWCKKASAITSDGYRVVYNEDIYNIIGIDHMNFKRKAMKLKCQKARR